jgi:hypothetical protein
MPIPVLRQQRPRFVTLLALAVLLLSLINLGGAYHGLRRWGYYVSLAGTAPVGFVTALNVIWGGVWLAIGTGLWRLAPWSRHATWIGIVLYGLSRALPPWIWEGPSFERERLPFALMLTAFATIISFIGLTRQRIRQAFDRTGEAPKS